MPKKITSLILLFLFIFSAKTGAQTENKAYKDVVGSLLPTVCDENIITIYYFHSKACPHCADGAQFLEKLAKDEEKVEVRDFEVSANQANALMYSKVGKILNVDVSSVPLTVIGEQYISGFGSDNTTGEEIRAIVNDYLNEQENIETTDEGGCKEDGKQIDVPFFGKINPYKVSIPLLTIVLGLMDGFNPCAMWALFFLISLLLGLKDRSRMWILGTAFIVTSAIVYYLFMAAWLNFFLFVGFIIWVRLLIGGVAIGSGIYNLREFYQNKEGVCKITQSEKRKRFFDQFKDVVNKKEFITALIGIILLAFAVNLVELICSAGLPAIYTNILTLNNLATWQYYLYILIYVFFFMIDDLFVFSLAMFTLKTVGIQGKYARYSRLVGAIVIFVIGILLIFKPELLMFG